MGVESKSYPRIDLLVDWHSGRHPMIDVILQIDMKMAFTLNAISVQENKKNCQLCCYYNDWNLKYFLVFMESAFEMHECMHSTLVHVTDCLARKKSHKYIYLS